MYFLHFSTRRCIQIRVSDLGIENPRTSIDPDRTEVFFVLNTTATDTDTATAKPLSLTAIAILAVSDSVLDFWVASNSKLAVNALSFSLTGWFYV